MDLADLLGRPARWASVLRWATLAGLELGAIGPFGSYKANLYSRLAYWTVLFWIGGLTLWPCVTSALVMAPRRGWPPVFAATVAVLAACVPLSVLSAAGCYFFWPLHAAGIRPLEWFGMTATVVLPSTAGLLWLELAQWRPAAVAGPVLPPDRLAAPEDADGLPGHLAEAALCLQMEDHFVRVHMAGRSHLHGATLRQAMRVVAHRDGLQVHRSWWVAREAVAGWIQVGRTIELMLVTDLRVPVARQRIAALRDAGWLDGSRRLAPAPGLVAA